MTTKVAPSSSAMKIVADTAPDHEQVDGNYYNCLDKFLEDRVSNSSTLICWTVKSWIWSTPSTKEWTPTKRDKNLSSPISCYNSVSITHNLSKAIMLTVKY
uniref:Uncharacterized protein n=1 Tax=Romanomermis culicivorax TaxID=13658 RepID=A0A915IV92_ROMCU